MAATEAQRKACKRYYERTKKNWKVFALRLNTKDDADVIGKLCSVPDKREYIKKLVRGDISG